ncbi:RTA1 like protein-domain-containing protein [Teratosphaeria destructans]|uniref:RTA1 like protein-domain-containing protein n=1 Tax=Teratosphaeria destructans TaxID=418781 RepID=A0A9W7SQ73_9PEZI|nr:RTA1 like protein-domain-containing protein [Teratosphaeria destructans]
MFTVTWLHTSTIEVLQAQRFCWVPFRFQRFGYTITNVVLALLQLTGSIDMVALATRWGANLGADLIIASYVTQMVFWLFIFAENTFVVIKTKGAIKRAERLDMSAGMPEPTILSVYRRYPNFQRWNQVIGLAIMIIGTGRNLMRLTELGVQMLRDTEWMTYAFDIYQMVIVMGAYAAFYLPGKLHEVKTTSLGQYCELAQAPDRV